MVVSQQCSRCRHANERMSPVTAAVQDDDRQRNPEIASDRIIKRLAIADVDSVTNVVL